MKCPLTKEWFIHISLHLLFLPLKYRPFFRFHIVSMVDTKNVTKCLNTERCREKKIENEEEMQINKTLSVLLLLFCLLNILRSLNFIRIFAPLALSLSVCLFVCEECSVELFSGHSPFEWGNKIDTNVSVLSLRDIRSMSNKTNWKGLWVSFV